MSLAPTSITTGSGTTTGRTAAIITAGIATAVTVSTGIAGTGATATCTTDAEATGTIRGIAMGIAVTTRAIATGMAVTTRAIATGVTATTAGTMCLTAAVAGTMYLTAAADTGTTVTGPVRNAAANGTDAAASPGGRNPRLAFRVGDYHHIFLAYAKHASAKVKSDV